MDRLAEQVWRERRARHVERLVPFATERVERMARRDKHPVRDFLFQYYSYRPAHLLRWSPGNDVLLENAVRQDLEWNEFTAVPGGMALTAESFPTRRHAFVRWATNYLEGIAERPPQFGCFGLHEWAMVYRATEIRHAQTPLRLSSSAIAEVVESNELCCTHFDAFRFFTPTAATRNRLALNRDVTDQFDQRGCIHVTMDLYRYAFKLSPWISGELLADAFFLAWRAREVDMRASPYELSEFGLSSIPVETKAGREQYVREQRLLAEAAVPVRNWLIDEYRQVCRAFPDASTNVLTGVRG